MRACSVGLRGRDVTGKAMARLMLGAGVLLGGCASLPKSGPTNHDIVAAQRAAPDFTITDIDAAVVDRLAAAQAGPTPLAALAGEADAELIGAGDVLQITIYEVGAALFSGRGQMLSGSGDAPPTGSGENLPPVVVGRDGGVRLPWVGGMLVAGRTPQAVAAEIADRLRGKSQSPQVIVSVRQNVANTVMVMGDVKKPGRVPLTVVGERLLDAIAEAGGPTSATQDALVQVHRGGRTVAAPLALVDAGSADDVRLIPQDRVSVLNRPRTYSVFGAAGKVSEYPFQSPRLNLAEALARAGGAADERADPRAVFVFRFEPALPDGAPAPGARPVAYRLNMMRADGYFLSQRFEMRPKDVVYVANARANVPTKFIQILNLFFSPFFTARALTN